MTLREYYATQTETLGMFELAWEQRYVEGERLLLTEDTRVGGVYLLGYVAEMVLKASYFRFTGAASGDKTASLMESAGVKSAAHAARVRHLQSVNAAVKQEDYKHDIEFWLQELLSERKRKGRRLRQQRELDLQTHAQTIYNAWRVNMRYLALRIPGAEYREFQSSVLWLKENYESLRR